MRIFLMAAAVLIALANAILYSLIGNNTFTNLFDFHLDPWSLSAMYVLCAVFAGLLVAGGLIGFAEKVLAETFFARSIASFSASPCVSNVASSLPSSKTCQRSPLWLE